MRGRKLLGRVIEETEEESEGACQLKCVDESRCLSYNFGPAEDGKRLKCHLSDSDRFAAVDNFTQDDEFSNRGIQVLCNGYNVEEDEKKRKRKRHSSGSIYFFFIKNFL